MLSSGRWSPGRPVHDCDGVRTNVFLQRRSLCQVVQDGFHLPQRTLRFYPQVHGEARDLGGHAVRRMSMTGRAARPAASRSGDAIGGRVAAARWDPIFVPSRAGLPSRTRYTRNNNVVEIPLRTRVRERGLTDLETEPHAHVGALVGGNVERLLGPRVILDPKPC